MPQVSGPVKRSSWQFRGVVYRQSELEAIDAALREVRGEAIEHEQSSRRLSTARAELAEAEAVLAELELVREREAADVERLSGGVRPFLVGLFGSLEDRREKETAELLAAEARRNDASRARDRLRAEIDDLEARRLATRGTTLRQAELLRQREVLLVRRDPALAERLAAIAGEEKCIDRALALLAEAARAARDALGLLDQLEAQLRGVIAWLWKVSDPEVDSIDPRQAVARSRVLAPAVQDALFAAQEKSVAAGVLVDVPDGLDLNELGANYVDTLIVDFQAGNRSQNALAAIDRVAGWLHQVVAAVAARAEREARQAEAWARERRELVAPARR
jgi:hypothetical protein